MADETPRPGAMCRCRHPYSLHAAGICIVSGCSCTLFTSAGDTESTRVVKGLGEPGSRDWMWVVVSHVRSLEQKLQEALNAESRAQAERADMEEERDQLREDRARLMEEVSGLSVERDRLREALGKAGERDAELDRTREGLAADAYTEWRAAIATYHPTVVEWLREVDAAMQATEKTPDALLGQYAAAAYVRWVDAGRPGLPNSEDTPEERGWQCGECGAFTSERDLAAACSGCGLRGDGTTDTPEAEPVRSPGEWEALYNATLDEINGIVGGHWADAPVDKVRALRGERDALLKQCIRCGELRADAEDELDAMRRERNGLLRQVEYAASVIGVHSAPADTPHHHGCEEGDCVPSCRHYVPTEPTDTPEAERKADGIGDKILKRLASVTDKHHELVLVEVHAYGRTHYSVRRFIDGVGHWSKMGIEDFDEAMSILKHAAVRAEKFEGIRFTERTSDPDYLHPTGKCRCAGEGHCEWCRKTDASIRAQHAEVADVALQMSEHGDPAEADGKCQWCEGTDKAIHTGDCLMSKLLSLAARLP